MKLDLLREHIRKTKAALGDALSFGVNIPLQRKDAEDLVNVCIEEGVKIVFTSAGNPALFTQKLKDAEVVVTHVVPSAKLARKAEDRGVDAVVAEGTETGGHNGVDEIPTFVLIPQVRDAVKIPVLAAGGIADGRGILAALALGADGVQSEPGLPPPWNRLCRHDSNKPCWTPANRTRYCLSKRWLPFA